MIYLKDKAAKINFCNLMIVNYCQEIRITVYKFSMKHKIIQNSLYYDIEVVTLGYI